MVASNHFSADCLPAKEAANVVGQNFRTLNLLPIITLHGGIVMLCRDLIIWFRRSSTEEEKCKCRDQIILTRMIFSCDLTVTDTNDSLREMKPTNGCFVYRTFVCCQ